MTARYRWFLWGAAALMIATPALAQDEPPPQVNIFGHPIASAPSVDAQVLELVLQGQSLFTARDYDGAIAAYNLALELDPESADARRGAAQALGYRGAIAAENGQYEASQADFDLATTLYPAIVDVSPFLVQRGYLAWLLGDLEPALADFEAAVALDDSPLAHEYRAHANFDLGNYQAALEDYNLSIGAGLQPSLSYYNRAVILADMGRTDAAIADFSRALEISPNWADAYLYRASLYAQQGDIESATPDYFAWIQGIEAQRTTQTDVSEPITLAMSEGQVYYIPFTALAGQRVTVTAEATTAGFDPLIVILNNRDEPIIASDDISAENFDSRIDSFRLPNGRDFTLVVSHAGGGSEGAVEVTLTVE